MSIPMEKNTLKTVKNLSKYKDLEIGMEKAWGMKTTAASVVIGALGQKKGTLDPSYIW